MHVPFPGRALARLVVLSLCIGLLLPTHVRAAGNLVIGEIGWAGSSLSTSDEWIELWNTGDTSLSLDGYKLLGAGGEAGIVFGPQDTIPARSAFLIANFHSTDTRSQLAVEANLVTSTLSISNETLSLSMVDPSGVVIDRVGNGRLPFAGTSTQAGKASMVRVSPVAAGEASTSWISASSAQHLKASNIDVGTPSMCDGCVLQEPPSVPSEEPTSPSPAEPSQPVPQPSSSPVDTVTSTDSSSSTETNTTNASVSESASTPSSTTSAEPVSSVTETAPTPVSPVTEPVIVTTQASSATQPSAESTVTDVAATSNTSSSPISTQATTQSTSTPAPSTTSNTAAVTTISSEPSVVVMTTPSSTASETTTHTSTTAVHIQVSQSPSSSTSQSVHVQLGLDIHQSVNVSVPSPEHDHDELKALIELLTTLLKQKSFQMAIVAPETDAKPTAAAKKASTSASADTAASNKTATAPKAAVKAASTTTKAKTTAKKPATTTAKKTTTSSKPAPMSTTISAAPSIAQDAPRVFLTGTVASPAGLLAKNQFVIQTPDGRGLLVSGNGKQPTPSIHQTIRVEGTLIANDDGLSLRMYAADRWSEAAKETVGEPRLVNLLSPSIEDEWSLIEVTGTVQNVAKQSVVLDLVDTEIRVKVPTVLDYRTERLKKGDVVRVRGLLGISKDEVAIHPRSAAEITIVDHASSSVAQASTTSPQFPTWMPIGAAGVTIAATHGVKRLQKYREQQRLNTMLTQAQDRLISQADLSSPHLV